MPFGLDPWWVFALPVAWMAGCALCLIVYRRQLSALWREPVFRHPVLVLESDDWGAGPLDQAEALTAIAGVLRRHRDTRGRAPVFNLAIVLAVPDPEVIATQGRYAPLCLDAAIFRSVLSALEAGRALGVFALQLHGMEHYWPAALMASRDERVARWLRQPAPALTEDLPSPLQSRWVDASSLPTRLHRAEDIVRAVTDEIEAYERILGAPPRIVVPPTFVWTRETERAWADAGIESIVTPGWRYTGRDAAGKAVGEEGPIFNGERAGRVTYLVRSDYFEPSRGRDAAYALRALARAAAEGRPCVLENHRDNFIRDESTRRHSMAELDELCRDAIGQHAGLRFLSSLELSRILLDRDPQWITDDFRARLRSVLARLRGAGRLGRWMSITGLTFLMALPVRLSAEEPSRARQSL